MSQHHSGRLGYQDGEPGFDWVMLQRRSEGGGGGDNEIYHATLEVNAEGHVVLSYAQPDSGTNHGTAMAIQVAEILGFTTLEQIRLVWGDSDLTPLAPGWASGTTTQVQGGALCNAADKLRKELLKRASENLKVDAALLQIRDGVISSSEDPKRRTTFAELSRANDGPIQMTGRCTQTPSLGRAMSRSVGTCFAEVEVDTWTGDWRFVRAVYCHDTGNVMNPLLASADQNGSLIMSTSIATDAIPWDREFPGTRHYSVGYLSYRLPSIMEPPEQTNIFINSLEPRWFFGAKGFAETAIGAPPGALANAIYNACGVRIRQHPITKDAIMAALRANQKGEAIV